MKKVVAKNELELEKYRQSLFSSKKRYRREQAKLPFEKKIEIVMKLNRFAREWRQAQGQLSTANQHTHEAYRLKGNLHRVALENR